MKSNGVIELTRGQAVARAILCSKDMGYFYGLGRGGRDPKAGRPYDSKGRVDCTGFGAWFHGFDRLEVLEGADYEIGSGGPVTVTDRDIWWNTDSILADALGPKRRFELVPKDEPVRPGDALVYGSTYENGERRPGHYGCIVGVEPGFIRGGKYWYLHMDVAHATPSHRLKHGNVVAITDARIWSKKGYIVRYKGWATEAGK